MARPTKKTPEILERICEEIATSENGLHKICEPSDMPKARIVFNWLTEDEEFLHKYTRAKDLQAEYMAQKILEISDDSSDDVMQVKKGKEFIDVENREFVSRSKLRVDARIWLMSKLAPKKYGNKVDVTTDGEKVNQITPEVVMAIADKINKNSK